MSRPPVLAVDFDGTLVAHEYPEIGAPVPGAVETLREVVASHGVRLVLFTMRGGEHLAAAVAWCEAHGLPLWGVNANPEQGSWTESPKPYANRYVDDAAVGCPLLPNPKAGGRPVVDWAVVRLHLLAWLDAR